MVVNNYLTDKILGHTIITENKSHAVVSGRDVSTTAQLLLEDLTLEDTVTNLLNVQTVP